MKPSILFVEDQPGVTRVVSDLLRAEGYLVESAADGLVGLSRAQKKRFDLLILDVMLPGLSGFEICQTVRASGFEGAILMLTARGQVQDRVDGLHLGADDYLVKPFNSNELLARVAALLRRLSRISSVPVLQFAFGNVTLDFQRAVYSKAGVPFSLSPKESDLLRMLIENRDQVLSRETILAQVWKDQPHITFRTVDVHIAWLRQKLEERPNFPEIIVTVRGKGYRFNCSE